MRRCVVANPVLSKLARRRGAIPKNAEDRPPMTGTGTPSPVSSAICGKRPRLTGAELLLRWFSQWLLSVEGALVGTTAPRGETMDELGTLQRDCSMTRIPGTGAMSSKGRPGSSAGDTPCLRRASVNRSGDKAAASASVLAEIERFTSSDGSAESLVARARQGDELAFAELYVHFYRRVHRYLSIALKNEEDAHEAAQDVFVKLFRHLAHYEQRTEPFANWLFRVVRNHALDFRKRQWRTEAVDPHELARRGGVCDGAAGSSVGLGELIGELPEAQRRVLVLRYVYDFTITDIAEALDKSADAVRHIHMRALRAVCRDLPEAERKRREKHTRALAAAR